MPVVSVKKVDEYDEELVFAAVSAHFEALNVAAELNPDTKVLIKPNLLSARTPDLAITTHPAVVKAVARWLKAQGVERVTIADSAGGMYTPAILRKLYAACGLAPLAELATLNEDVSSVEKGGMTILKPVADADYIINCAKLKTHGLTTMTAGVKNLFGCIPGLKKPEIHCLKPTIDGFADFLIDLCEVVKPNVTLIDAIDCMEGNGPGGGTLRHMGCTLCSRSPYAVDEQCALLMGIKPNMAATVRASKNRGMLTEAAELVGDALVPANPPFALPDAIASKERFFSVNGIFHHYLGRRQSFPIVLTDKCVGCGRCAESCPKHLITVENHKANMQRKGCIACFCCQEMCPAHAIAVQNRRGKIVRHAH